MVRRQKWGSELEQSGAELAFGDIVREVGAYMKSRGYRKRALTFSRFYDGNRAIVAFQRSVSNTGDRVKFTLNLGIISARTPDQLTVHEAHVLHRIGRFVPGQFDYWWEVYEKNDGEGLGAQIVAIFSETALPFIEGHVCDTALVAYAESEDAGSLDRRTRRDLLEMGSQLRAN